jgi:hypothetical protein
LELEWEISKLKIANNNLEEGNKKILEFEIELRRLYKENRELKDKISDSWKTSNDYISPIWELIEN